VLLIATKCPATLAHLCAAGIPHTAVATVDAAETYLADTEAHHGMGHLIAYGPDVAAANDVRPIDGARNTMIIVPGEAQPADWRAAVYLGVDAVIELPLGAEWLSHAVADAARTVAA
jgi:hypothetical protein